ncbi:DUF2501 domain-containing protein [Pseudorhodoferax sp.]|uniref:DUF2501 domain-containing protein n=1 Tax=Pseudorhodoferax sp. TaxID=1993553 RepID=UPI002DD6A2DC|nr:DUF2501 domain-containing protein [Pseudorhodoferax sp.]
MVPQSLRISTLSVLLLAAASVHAAGPLDKLKSAAGEQLGNSGSLLSGLGLPSIGSGTASNAAGVLQYCIQNNYLAGGAAGVKDAVLGKIGLGGDKAEQDKGYQSGLGGILGGSDGSSFDLGKIKADLKQKACDYVLDNAKSLL